MLKQSKYILRQGSDRTGVFLLFGYTIIKVAQTFLNDDYGNNNNF